MRVVKEAEERKNEILDVAEELFAIKGFDQTSTNDILAKIGIARGTLYYHFKSKEEILDGVIDRMVRTCVAKAAAVVQDHSLSVLDRLTYSIMALNVDSSIGAEVMNQIHKPQNALMHQKMQESLLAGVVPLLTELVEEGIAEGVFQTDFPQEAVEMTTIYSNIAFDDLNTQTSEEMQRRIQAFIYHTERVLGAQPGSLQEALIKIFKAAQ